MQTFCCVLWPCRNLLCNTGCSVIAQCNNAWIRIKSLKTKYKAIVDRVQRSDAGNEEDLPSGQMLVRPVHLLDSLHFFVEEHEVGNGECEVVSRALSPDQSVSQPQTSFSLASWPETTIPSSSQPEAPYQSDTNRGPSGSCQETPSHPGRCHSSSRMMRHPSQRKKGRAREERMKWDKGRNEIEDEQDKIAAAANDWQLMLSAMGQMMAFFTQFTDISSTPYFLHFNLVINCPVIQCHPFQLGIHSAHGHFHRFPLMDKHSTSPIQPSLLRLLPYSGK